MLGPREAGWGANCQAGKKLSKSASHTAMTYFVALSSAPILQFKKRFNLSFRTLEELGEAHKIQ